MTKLEMVREIIKPENRAQEDYAESVARRMAKADIERQYEAFIRFTAAGYKGYKITRCK